MITSSSNQQIKRIQQLQKTSKARHKQKAFVVEGPRMAFEAPREWVERIYVSESFQAEQRWQEQLAGAAHEEVSDSVLKSISDTQTPQGILAVVRMPEYSLEELLVSRHPCGQKDGEARQAEEAAVQRQKPGQKPAAAPLLLVLDTVQDPGNLGTMLRTGEGAGISGVLMNRTTADLFSPKVIRSTMGSIYRVPFVITEDLPGDIRRLKQQGIRFYAAHLAGRQSYDEVDYSGGSAFMIGNEGNGLSDEIAELADTRIRIPMAVQVESLNAAMAAGLLMYEAARR